MVGQIRKAFIACNFNCYIENERLLKVIVSHVHYKNSNIFCSNVSDMAQHRHCYNRPLTVHGTSCHFPWPWVTFKVIHLLQAFPKNDFSYSCAASAKWHSTSCGPAVTAELLVWLVVQFDQCNTKWSPVVPSSSTPLLFPIFFPSTTSFLYSLSSLFFSLSSFTWEEFAVIQSKPRTATA